MNRLRRKDEEGAMGIGTLIIFIAMVLVAAVAASVLISTAFDLQEQARRTGQEAILEVSSSFLVHDRYGLTDDATNSEIETIKLKIGLAAGANGQDLNQTVIQIQSADGEVNLLAAADNTTAADGTHFGWDSIIKQEGEDGSQYVDSGDLYEVTLDISEIGDIDSLGTQARVDINIIPKHGTPSYVQITTPPTITTKYVRL
ncbi:MAG: archaellin/type IV pilin N-terminal domain-containing protein [Thermoplasmata archaeon]